MPILVLKLGTAGLQVRYFRGGQIGSISNDIRLMAMGEAERAAEEARFRELQDSCQEKVRQMSIGQGCKLFEALHERCSI